MRTYSQFLEDLEQRKAALVQRSKTNGKNKQQNAQSVSDASQRFSAAKKKCC